MTGAVVFQATLAFPADVGAVRTSTAVPGLREWAGGRFLAERYRTASAARMLLRLARAGDGGSRANRGKLATRCRRVVGGLGRPTGVGRPGMLRLATFGMRTPVVAVA
ncbi:hypothetical protein ACWEHA_17240 [Amycolatopsis nivea]